MPLTEQEFSQLEWAIKSQLQINYGGKKMIYADNLIELLSRYVIEIGKCKEGCVLKEPHSDCVFTIHCYKELQGE